MRSIRRPCARRQPRPIRREQPGSRIQHTVKAKTISTSTEPRGGRRSMPMETFESAGIRGESACPAGLLAVEPTQSADRQYDARAADSTAIASSRDLLGEVWPEGVDEHELCACACQIRKLLRPLLAAGADDEIGIRNARRLQMAPRIVSVVISHPWASALSDGGIFGDPTCGPHDLVT